MTRYSSHLVPRQVEPADPTQVQNNAGGYVFSLDCWKQLERWLILGAEGGTYYVGERELTRQNATTIQQCLQTDGIQTVQTIVDVSQSGRAPKNDPAIFALALAAADQNEATRQAAFAALPKVCRTGTHLFHFAESVEQVRRWGAGLRKAIGNWYTQSSVDQVAWQAVKYQQRDGWSHRDLLRLSHPKAETPARAALFQWMVGGKESMGARTLVDTKSGRKREYAGVDATALPQVVQGFEQLKHASSVHDVIQLLTAYKLPHECIPNQWKKHPEVWEALLPHMGLTALLRNLGRMSAIGLLTPSSESVARVEEALLSKTRLKKERVHPLAVLMALKVYQQGHGEKGHLAWTSIPALNNILNDSFYLAFDAIEPAHKKFFLGLDCSGSMAGPRIAGSSLTPREASAAMAMVTARTETNWHVSGFHDTMVPIMLSPSMHLQEVISVIGETPWGTTDCAKPMIWATEKRMEVDAFVIYTDNETYYGNVHPHHALETYRQTLGRAAKLIVVGMTSTRFSIANPQDAGMLDVVGFDASAPAVISDFVK